MNRILLIAAVMTFALGGCAKNPTTGDRDFVLMSEQQEIALGRQNHEKIMAHYGQYDDPSLQAYVQRIGDQLGNISHRKNLYYRFTVLDSDEVNAFALPGGYIYITRGLLGYLNSEAEMAAVLGHEIGHVTARHTVRQHTTSTVTGILGAVIAAKAGTSGAQDLTNLLGTAIVRGYGREHELEADRLGAEYLARGGYDPDAMIEVIGTLKNQELFEQQLARQENREPRIYHGVFSTHPDNDDRLKTVINKAQALKKPGVAKGESREQFLQRLDGVVFGDSAKEGVRRGRNFYHKELDFALTLPADWKVENHPEAIVAYTTDRKHKIQIFTSDLNLKVTPQAFLSKRLNISNITNGSQLSPAGLQAYTARANAGSAFDTRPVRVGVVYYKQRAFVFVGFSDEARNPYQYESSVIETINSFRPLSKAEAALADPLRIKVIKATSGTTFSSLAKGSKIPNHPEEQLRLLNDMYPSGEPKSGMLVKIVK